MGPNAMERMATRLRTSCLSAACALVACSAQGQEVHPAEAEEHARHEVSVLLAHTHVAQGIDANGNAAWLVLPSWGLNYNHWLSPHWAIGLHTDLITETFVVTENLHGGEEKPVVERTKPIAPALMATYRPHEHWAFTLGGGVELAKEEDLALIRAGTEYTIHLGGPWETSGSLAYDFRLNAYDSWTLGLGVTRTFH